MSYIIKKSITISGHRTSISLEAPFWEALHEVATFENISVPKLVQLIEKQMMDENQSNLSSFIKVYLLVFYKKSSRHP
jgi:predicted DNA-binding ribbon-helix-helix protein